MKKTILLLACLMTVPLSLWADEPAKDPQPTTEAAEATTAPAQEESLPVAASQEAPSQEVSPEAVAEAPVSAPGNVTVDFKDADIQNVLRILAYKSGVNIVAGKDVVGSVTIRLVDVPWEKALDVIMKTYGYGYERHENVIRVSTVENLKKEDLSTEVFVLNYSKSNEVDKSVKEILSDRGKMRADTRSNSLIVTDTPTNLQNIRTVIGRLDSQTPQVVIQAKVIELTLGSAEKLGIDWNLSASAYGARRPITAPWGAVNRGRLSNLYPYGRGTQTGSVSNSGGVTSTTIEDFPKGKGGVGADDIQPTFPVADKADFEFGAMDFTNFSVLMEMINKRNDSKILSEPHVTVLNNQEAKILVGEVIAIPTFERNATTGRMEITGYEDRDLGIRLAVTPQVNSTGEIVVTVHPEITTLAGYDELTTDIRAPRFTTREALTNVRIKSGQTIAIGGLIKEDTVDIKNKVPLLGDVPVLDKFFSYQSKTTTKTDLLFFMTVTVVGDNVVPSSHTL